METKSFKEIEDFVLNHITHCSPEDIVKLYEAITDEQVEVEDWKN